MKNKILILIILVLIGILAFFYSKWHRGYLNGSSTADVSDFVNKTFNDNRIASPSAKEQVITEEKSAVKEKEICGGKDQNNFDCYEAYYTNLVKNESIKTAFDDLRARYPVSEYIKSQCHPLTHVIGREASLKFKDVSDAYAAGDSFCWSGYYHGVLEGIIGRIGFNNLAKSMDSICSEVAKRKQYSFDHYNCVHGLGHGVMAITNDELFKSLAICDNLKDGWEKQSCWSGAFMENIIVDNKNHFTKYLKASEPLYPCDAVEDGYKNTCYLMQTSYMLKITNGDFKKVFDLCGGAGLGYKDTCFQSLGRDASGRSVSDVVQTKSWCMLGKGLEEQQNCFIGAVKDFMSYLHDDKRARELCASLDVKELQVACSGTVDSYSKIF